MDPVISKHLEALEKRSRFLTYLVMALVIGLFLMTFREINILPVHAEDKIDGKIHEFDTI